jgi:Na+/melibiose symporter-like transporter
MLNLKKNALIVFAAIFILSLFLTLYFYRLNQNRLVAAEKELAASKQRVEEHHNLKK